MQRSILDILVRTEYFLHKKSQVQSQAKVKKNRTFPCFFANNGHFFVGGICANPARKDRLLKFWTEKNGFQTRKVKFYGFSSKMAIFLIGCFWANLARKHHLFYILDKKERFLDKKCQVLKKSKKMQFSKGVSPWFWSKIGHFSIFLFFAIQARKNLFYDILERKNTFLGYKNKKIKTWKN